MELECVAPENFTFLDGLDHPLALWIADVSRKKRFIHDHLPFSCALEHTDDIWNDAFMHEKRLSLL